MNVNEKDVGLIEAYLDNELSADESAAAAGRIARDPAMKLLADELRAERAVRKAIFAAGEPGEVEAAALNDRIFAATDRYASAVGQSWRMRWFGAAAACLVAGFAGGYALHGGGGDSTNATAPQNRATENVAVAPSPRQNGGVADTGLRTVSVPSVPVQFVNFKNVSVRDATGRVVGTRLVSDEQGFHDFLNNGGANPAGRPVAPNIRLISDEK